MTTPTGATPSSQNLATPSSSIPHTTPSATSPSSTLPIVTPTSTATCDGEAGEAVEDKEEVEGDNDEMNLPEKEIYDVDLVKDEKGLGLTVAGYICEKGININTHTHGFIE